ncbi:MAG: hypothetical protein AB7S77_13175 [Desulfatirhabdiaceae bacterium]
MTKKKMKSKHKSHKKISEMLLSVGEGFIQQGKTPEQRENYLRIVGSAWNMACLEGELREKYIKDYLTMYIKSQNMDDSQGEPYEKDIRKLIDRKLSLFPLVKKEIVNVHLIHDDGQDKVMVASIDI